MTLDIVMPMILWRCPKCGYTARSALPPAAVAFNGRPVADGCAMCFFAALGNLIPPGVVPMMVPMDSTKGAGT